MSKEAVLPAADEKALKKPKYIDDIQVFDKAVREAQLEARGSNETPIIEVSDDLFNKLNEDPDSKSLTYGKPGVRVFRGGTVDDILDEEALPIEKYYERELVREKAKNRVTTSGRKQRKSYA